MKKRHNIRKCHKTLIAAACAVPYLVFAGGGGVNTAHAADEPNQDGRAHTTTRATRRTDTLEVYLGPDDVTERDVAVEVDGDWSLAAGIAYDNYGNFWSEADPVGKATLTDMDFKARGEGAQAVRVWGNDQPGDAMSVHIGQSVIAADGEVAIGVVADNYVRLRLDEVDVSVKTGGNYGWSGGGISAYQNARVDVYGGAVKVDKGFGVEVVDASDVHINRGRISTAGDAKAHGLKLHVVERVDDGQHHNRITLTNGSVVQAPDASAVWAAGKLENRLVVQDSRISGDRLATVVATRDMSGLLPMQFGNLTLTASGSQLAGGTAIDGFATLTMSLGERTDWSVRPTAAGETHSAVTFLSISDSDIRFHHDGTGLYQRLVIGHGDTHGNTRVYQAIGDSARVHLNTLLNDGGALANQHTDRLVILGDASGSTWLQVTPAAGSPGAQTGDTASDGISVAQVYGQASGDTFKLAGDYVAVGPYQYRLQAFDPDASDADQRDPQALAAGAEKFWDFRLLGAMGRAGFGDSTTPEVVPQLPSYLAAPTALFQARLFDIDTWHRRQGDASHAEEGKAGSARGEVYLRSYGGNYDYRSQSGASSYASKTRYHAVQVGGNAVIAEKDDATWRAGAAANVGELSFQPQDIEGNRKTRLKAWSVSPTVTWQHSTGGYVDALVAVGGFKGGVSTRQRGKTATLKGQSAAASVEAGVPFKVNGLIVLPQVQAVYQRLKFDRSRDVDGIAVNLGTHSQLTVRSGGEIRKAFQNAAGHAIQVYGKAHVAHTLNDSKKVNLSGDFRTGKTGTVLETGVGVDAVLAKGRGVIYADLTRQQRIGRAGHNGWTVNVGVRARF